MLVVVAKISLATALLAYLLVQVQKQAGFERLMNEPKNWPLLALGLACTMVAISLAFVRWHLLLTALGLNFRLIESMRLGALGFALNFVSLGSIGGDLFKAIFAAKDSPGRRTEAISTVVLDRLLGMMMMLALASAASFLVDWAAAPTGIRVLVQTIRFTAVAMLVGVTLVLLVPALSGPGIRGLLNRVPVAGPIASRLIGIVSDYRDEKRYVLGACAISIFSNTFFILSFYFVAQGLPVQAPSLAEHFVIVPTANLAGAIPATPSGLGTVELAVDKLYQAVPTDVKIPAGDGTLVALGQRATMILFAAACLVFYVARRGDFRLAMQEIEEVEAEAEAVQAS
jgi:glycosyltransferase 2 family protein